MEIKVNVVLSATPELLTALQALAGLKAPEAAKSIVKKSAPPVTEKAPEAVQPSASVSVPAAANGVANTHTLESLRAIAVPKSKAGKKDQIKAWLSETGYASLQDLQEKDFEAFHSFIQGL